MQHDDKQGFWAAAIRLTALGWMLAIPITAGALIGRWLDSRFNQGSLWTVTLIFIGIVIGVYSVYITIYEEFKDEDRK